MKQADYKLPSGGVAREALRVKGQFWTPAWTAEAMAEFVLNNTSDHVFDPAIGEGAFLRAAKTIAHEQNRRVTLLGCELDHAMLDQARESGLTETDLAQVEIRDFVLNPPLRKFKAIVANPPYIRHHRLSAETKAALRGLGAKLTGKPLDGRAGLHIYFLLRALELLDADGRLAFIMPADTCEGVFAAPLWAWIAERFRLDAVVTFAAAASPFPRVDTNPLIFMISNRPPRESLIWARCVRADTDELRAWVRSGFSKKTDAIEVHHTTLVQALSRGLSRKAIAEKEYADGVPLSRFARVMRGIATGANDFFFLTAAQSGDLQIPNEFLRRAIGRTRDVLGDTIDSDALARLEAKGRPTLLFAPDARPLDEFPRSVREYLQRGEAQGLSTRALIRTRRPWYKMEQRLVPPILFAYLGRRNARFIRNSAAVLPLTSFLCIYPHDSDPASVEMLWQALADARTLKNLSAVAKSYGDGAIKVEPRALERLMLPHDVVFNIKPRSDKNENEKFKSKLINRTTNTEQHKLFVD